MKSNKIVIDDKNVSGRESENEYEHELNASIETD